MRLLPVLILLIISPFLQTYAQIITTVAGWATGNGAVATNFGLTPMSVTTDSKGNVYFSSQNNSVIYLLAAGTNVLTVVAGNGGAGYNGDGGLAIAASLDMPQGITVDGNGNIFIADEGNNRIRKVTAATGIISTVAGNGTAGYNGDGGQATAAELYMPTGVAVDGNGNIYIAEKTDNRIRKVDAGTGIINVAAGGGTQGDGGPADSAELGSPWGVAVDGNGNLYIADQGADRIRKVNAATGIITTVAGGGNKGLGDGGPADSAELNSPIDVAIDGDGNIYIADLYSSSIRKVDAGTGIITTVAGNDTLGYNGDGGMANQAKLYYPIGVAIDNSGNIYIADLYNLRLRKVDGGTGIISTIAGNGTKGYNGDGSTADLTELSSPSGIALDASGNIYIADAGNNRVRKVNAANGIITTVAGNGYETGFIGNGGYSGDGGPADAAELSSPLGVAVDDSGNIYIADAGNNRIRKVNAGTGIITTVAGGGDASSGNDWLGDGGPAEMATLSGPSGVALDDSGNIYIADTYNSCVRKVDAITGIISIAAGSGDLEGYYGDGGLADTAELYRPAGVAVDSSRNIYIADQYNGRIRKVDAATGIITTVAGGAFSGLGDGGPADSAKLSFPTNVAIGSSANIYIADNQNNRVRKVDARTGIITTVAGNGIFGYMGDDGPADLAELNYPAGVTFDGGGNMYIADYANNVIRKVTGIANGITPVTQTVQLSLYPNPATGYLIVSAPGNQSSGVLSITDMQGRVLYTQHLLAGAVVKQQIDVSPYAAGVYVLSMITADTKMSRQFVVMK